jgi:LuxR family maltose regulon positive regulatory protein
LPPYAGVPGLRPLLWRFVDGAERRLPDAPTPLRGSCQVLRGWLHLMAGDVPAAVAAAAAADADARWLAHPAILDAPLRSLQAVLAAVQGDASAALRAMDALMTDIRRSGVPMRAAVYLDLTRWLAMRCAALLDDPVYLRRTAQALVDGAAGPDGVGRSWLDAAPRAAAAAHLAQLDGDLDGAVAHWRAMLDDPAHGGLYGQRSDVRLRLADALVVRGDPPAAAAAVLGPLFENADDDEPGAAAFAGPRLLTRLAGANWEGALTPAAAARLCARAVWSVGLAEPPPDAVPQPAQGRGASGHDDDGKLSAREREVLALIADGRSNKLIARELGLSPHTVKRHVANLLDKLAVDTRGRASAWWHARPR